MLTPHPRATYRFQFHAGFTFRDALHQLPYLQALGISHVYASPIATARTGSSHGYDVCDPRRVNPELGGEDGLMTLLLAVRERGLGWLQDVVPNHMAADVANPLWRKVLAFGPGDPSAALFDIDWDNQRSPNKLLLPILARPLADVLDEGGMRPSVGDDGVVIACADQRLPISPRSLGEILSADHRLADLGRRLVAGLTLQAEARDEHFAQIWQLPPAERQSLQAWCEQLDRRQLEGLLARQYWQASWWRLGREVSGYRRFFNIDGLVGVAVERPEAFALQHTLAFGLWDAGLISGVRVDHIDGLRDPRAYLRNLRERMPEAWIVVEKILGQDERLPADWPVDGTTGYESIALLAPACSDPAGLTAIRTATASWCGDRPSAEQDRIARRDLHRLGLHGDAMRIVRLLRSHDANDGRWFDVADAHLAEALAAIAARLDRYRTYGDPSGAALILATARRATEDAPHLAEVILRLGSLLAEAEPGEAASPIVEALLRFQQLTGPVMAKGREDCLFYRDVAWICHNEVGAEPGLGAITPQRFVQQALARGGFGLSPGSTHDTKRSEDVRARLAALTWHADDWNACVRQAMTAPDHQLHPADRYFALQTLIGSWRPGIDDDSYRDRLAACLSKSLREADLRSHWTAPNTDYEQCLLHWVWDIVSGSDQVHQSCRQLIVRSAPTASDISVIQAVLRCTLPGIPDIYRGAEVIELSLVDPDNRRPVDTAALAQSLATSPIADAKLAAIRRCLQLRTEDPDGWTHGATTWLLPVEAPPGLFAYARRLGEGRTVVVAGSVGTHRNRLPELVATSAAEQWLDDVAIRQALDAPRKEPYAIIGL